ncbi:hypothetical protein NQ315_001936 [Exocentrus adspersus]|uniref:PX domain-containing protein n=1 Tax=Exocentrus adspersus TaxID=1586481 RepID=A0AAV8W9W2_9CUCU|nr:hypothetical protein NQ315_001936 [Exocentrus adspersus]
MTTDLSSATIPPLYREIFDICSNDGEPIHEEVYHCLLLQCKLSREQLKTIWDLAGVSRGYVGRTNLYKTLVLVAYAQQGKQLSNKLFDNCIETEYPTPEVSDLTPVKNLKMQLDMKQKDAVGFNYATIVQTDFIDVHLVPEKKGLFLKHSEYVVTSKRFNSKVTRRYNDFVALHELILNRFPYRLVPSLPPKKIVSDAHFLEARRRGLHRWLTLVCRHPVICQDALIQYFLTDQGPEFQHRIKEIFRRVPDEFMTSDIAAIAKDLLPSDHGQIAANSQNIRNLVNIVGKLKHICESDVDRQSTSGRDLGDFATQLKSLSALNITHGEHFIENWKEMQGGFGAISREMQSLSAKSLQHANAEQLSVCERLSLLLDILIAHKDLCERLEKGLHHDHALALSKLLSLKKRKLQGAENVEKLESKMLTQESVITNMELRSDFSLYCLHVETLLVYAYLGTLSSILNNLIALKIKSHSEELDELDEL